MAGPVKKAPAQKMGSVSKMGKPVGKALPTKSVRVTPTTPQKMGPPAQKSAAKPKSSGRGTRRAL